MTFRSSVHSEDLWPSSPHRRPELVSLRFGNNSCYRVHVNFGLVGQSRLKWPTTKVSIDVSIFSQDLPTFVAILAFDAFC